MARQLPDLYLTQDRVDPRAAGGESCEQTWYVYDVGVSEFEGRVSRDIEAWPEKPWQRHGQEPDATVRVVLPALTFGDANEIRSDVRLAVGRHARKYIEVGEG